MPMVKHIISALKSSGCDVDITRNIQCDICAPGSEIEHAGGYDPALNQVFVCANNTAIDYLVRTKLVKQDIAEAAVSKVF